MALNRLGEVGGGEKVLEALEAEEEGVGSAVEVWCG